jgi:hypothetical protein
VLPAVYVLLADDRDKADLTLAHAGQEPHYRADFDNEIGFSTEPEPQQQSGMADVVAMADWVRQANTHMR